MAVGTNNFAFSDLLLNPGPREVCHGGNLPVFLASYVVKFESFGMVSVTAIGATCCHLVFL
jgi:hypothetical protein